METVPTKKVLVSYLITSLIIFVVSATISLAGAFGEPYGSLGHRLSMEVLILIHLTVILLSNLVLHGFFYYGGFSTSPIMKGIGIGAVLGVTYFVVGVFALNIYDINGSSVQHLMGAISGRLIEYGTGGIATAVISVSDIHKWGLLKAF